MLMAGPANSSRRFRPRSWPFPNARHHCRWRVGIPTAEDAHAEAAPQAQGSVGRRHAAQGPVVGHTVGHGRAGQPRHFYLSLDRPVDWQPG